MADARISQMTVRGLTEGNKANVSQFAVRSVYNFPSEAGRVSQLVVRSLDQPSPSAQVSQLIVRAVVRGRVANPNIRVWTFTLDQHDYYVLRLGDDLTLVYDTYSEQWVDWSDMQSSAWSLASGVNWIGGQALAQNYGSNVVAGDDNFGLLWFLDPEQPYDQHPLADNPVQEVYFDRITMGQFPMNSREVQPCYALWLTTDMGDPAYTGAGVSMQISDDAGKTFFDAGTVTVNLDTDKPQLAWYSLGQVEAPGRLFKITDDGAIARIDALEMNDPDDEDGG